MKTNYFHADKYSFILKDSKFTVNIRMTSSREIGTTFHVTVIANGKHETKEFIVDDYNKIFSNEEINFEINLTNNDKEEIADILTERISYMQD